MEQFERIYIENRDAVTDYVRRRASAAVVDDVVSETFLVCLRKIDRVPDEPLPWLYAVARKTLANHRRKHPVGVADLLAAGSFERVLGSLHCLSDGEQFSEMPNLFRERLPANVIRDYLAELVRLIEGSDVFTVLGHIDYALRYWPTSAGAFEVHAFESEFRHALSALADTGRALEVNTRGRLPQEVVSWWREEGGEAVTFGSDAHTSTGLARYFTEAAAMVVAAGFHPGRGGEDLWLWRRSATGG